LLKAKSRSGEGAGLDAEYGRGEDEMVVVLGLLVDGSHERGRVLGERCFDLRGLVGQQCPARREDAVPDVSARRRLI